MHISVGAMDAHTQILFYGMCFGPFLVLMAVAYREHRRSSRADPMEPSMPHDTDRYLAPELRRAARPSPRAQSRHDDEGEEYDSSAGVQPPV
jgi:hypothetical protein